MRKLKLFWSVNFLLTILSIVFTLCIFLDLNQYIILKNIYYFITCNELISPFLFVTEWVQISLIICILLWKREERTHFHWLYLSVLFILAIFKIFFYFFGVIGFARGEA
ncbi:hypothetical protein DRF60_01085 [Chryseobacterium elymi]|uniref:DUF5658 domain-containing protein n=1 Tax=Chryseobacterium elymi TaxID=395936 RepID=A0A3D9DR40_9FLAO|nr:hypothetical protein DRF60_01085 [Chryseobacterium elymi]